MIPLKLTILGTDAGHIALIRDVLAAQLPGATAETLDPAHLRTRPVADAVVLDGRTDAARGAEIAARLRAMGFAGAVVVISHGTDETRSALAAAGAAETAPDALASGLVAVLAEQLALAGSEHAMQAMSARRLIAAGEIALRFQHSLNNPLAGILAEAQLMQLDAIAPEQHEALERIVGLCRRIVELGKSLDGMGERK